MGLHFVNQRIPAEDVRILQPQNAIKVRYLTQKILRFDCKIVAGGNNTVNVRDTTVKDAVFS